MTHGPGGDCSAPANRLQASVAAAVQRERAGPRTGRVAAPHVSGARMSEERRRRPADADRAGEHLLDLVVVRCRNVGVSVIHVENLGNCPYGALQGCSCLRRYDTALRPPATARSPGCRLGPYCFGVDRRVPERDPQQPSSRCLAAIVGLGDHDLVPSGSHMRLAGGDVELDDRSPAARDPRIGEARGGFPRAGCGGSRRSPDACRRRERRVRHASLVRLKCVRVQHSRGRRASRDGLT